MCLVLIVSVYNFKDQMNVASFVELFGAQDDMLMEAMDSLVQIHTSSSRYVVEEIKLIRRPVLDLPVEVLTAVEVIVHELNPCSVFAEFLKMIGYDPLVLVDFLLSDDTNFLAFFLRYRLQNLFAHFLDSSSLLQMDTA